jgi:hypothetical protein
MSFSGGAMGEEPVYRARVAGVSVIACIVIPLRPLHLPQGRSNTWRAFATEERNH